MAVFEEIISLVDHMSGPAEKMSKSVLSVKDKMGLLGGQIKATQAAMLKAQATGNTKMYAKLNGELGQYRNSLGSLESTEKAAGQSLAGMKTEALAAAGAYAAVAAAAAVVVVAIGAVIFKGAQMAIEASEAKTQMLSMFDALGEGAISGERVDNMLDDMRSKLGVTKDSMVPLVKEFMAMGVTSEDALTKMTTAALSAKALTGGSDAAAESFTKLAKKIQVAADTGQALKIPIKGLGSLADMGLNVNDVAAKMGISSAKLAAGLKAGTVNAKAFGVGLQDALIDKGAGPLQTMSLSVANLGGVLKEYVGDMFEDLGSSIKPFLLEVKELFGIFDSKAKPSGMALKQGIEGFFKNVFALATRAVPYIKHFLLDIVILGLKAYISLKPILKWFLDLRNNVTVMSAIMFVFKGLAIAVGAVAVVVGALVGVFVLMTAAAGVVAATLWAIVGAAVGVVGKISEVLGELPAMAMKLGTDFVAGLVGGITSGASAVVNAVSGLADSAKNTFKNVLGIHSPSKVMMEMGNFMGQGVAKGVDASASDVQSSSAGLGKIAAKGASDGMSGGGGGSSSKGSGVSVTVEAGAIVIQGAGRDISELTEEAVSMIFERIALMQGV